MPLNTRSRPRPLIRSQTLKSSLLSLSLSSAVRLLRRVPPTQSTPCASPVSLSLPTCLSPHISLLISLSCLQLLRRFAADAVTAPPPTPSSSSSPPGPTALLFPASRAASSVTVSFFYNFIYIYIYILVIYIINILVIYIYITLFIY